MRPADSIYARNAGTELLERRQANQKIFHVGQHPDDPARSRFAADFATGFIHYQALNREWLDIDTGLRTSHGIPGWETRIIDAGYAAGVDSDLRAPWQWELRKGEQAIRLKPVELRSGDRRWPLNVDAIAVPLADDGIRWHNAFGDGIHLEVRMQPGVVAKAVILDRPLDLTDDLDLVLAAQYENIPEPRARRQPSDIGDRPVHSLRLGELGLRWPISWDASSGHGRFAAGRLIKRGDKLIHRVSREWLAQAQYPVTIDTNVDTANAAGWDTGHSWNANGTPQYDTNFFSQLFAGNDGAFYADSMTAWRFTGVNLYANYHLTAAYMLMNTGASNRTSHSNTPWNAAIVLDNSPANDYSGLTAATFRSRFPLTDTDQTGNTTFYAPWHVANICVTDPGVTLPNTTPSLLAMLNHQIASGWTDGSGKVGFCVKRDNFFWTENVAELEWDDVASGSTLHVEWDTAETIVQPDATAGIDTQIVSSVPTTNYGTATTMSVGCHSKNTEKDHALIKFDLAAIAGKSVVSAAITLDATTAICADGDAAHVYLCTKAWVEEQATWNIYSTGNNWTAAGGDTSTPSVGFNLPTGTGTFTIATSPDLVALVQDALDNHAGSLNILIKLDSEPAADHGITFATSDDTTAANRPKIDVVWAPPTLHGNASVGAVTVAGGVATTSCAVNATATAAAVTPTGGVATVAPAVTKTPTVAAITVTGKAATVAVGNTNAAATAGSITIGGGVATIAVARTVTPTVNAVTAAGAVATVATARTLAITAAAVSVTPTVAGHAQAITVTPVAAIVTVSGKVPTAFTVSALTATVAIVNVRGTAAQGTAIIPPQSTTATVGALTVTPKVPQTNIKQPATVASISIGRGIATVAAARAIAATVASVTVAGTAATAAAARTVAPTAVAVQVAGGAAVGSVANAPQTAAATVGAISVVGTAAGVASHPTMTVGAIVLTGETATIVTHITVTATAAVIGIGGAVGTMPIIHVSVPATVGHLTIGGAIAGTSRQVSAAGRSGSVSVTGGIATGTVLMLPQAVTATVAIITINGELATGFIAQAVTATPGTITINGAIAVLNADFKPGVTAAIVVIIGVAATGQTGNAAASAIAGTLHVAGAVARFAEPLPITSLAAQFNVPVFANASYVTNMQGNASSTPTTELAGRKG